MYDVYAYYHLLSLFILTTDLQGMSHFSYVAIEEFKAEEIKIT